MNYRQVKQFFGNFNLLPNTEYKPMTTKTCRIIAQVAIKWYGQEFAEMVANCFVPTEPNKVVRNESELRFHFDYPTEAEVGFWASRIDWTRKINGSK